MVKESRKGFNRSQKEWEESISGHIGKLIDRISVDDVMKATALGVGTVVCHNLNLAGTISWFSKTNQRVETGLPYPFHERIKFPWETADEPTWEDQVTEWGLPLILSWILVYHPEAVAKFVDAMVPF